MPLADLLRESSERAGAWTSRAGASPEVAAAYPQHREQTEAHGGSGRWPCLSSDKRPLPPRCQPPVQAEVWLPAAAPSLRAHSHWPSSAPSLVHPTRTPSLPFAFPVATVEPPLTTSSEGTGTQGSQPAQNHLQHCTEAPSLAITPAHGPEVPLPSTGAQLDDLSPNE